MLFFIIPIVLRVAILAPDRHVRLIMIRRILVPVADGQLDYFITELILIAVKLPAIIASVTMVQNNALALELISRNVSFCGHNFDPKSYMFFSNIINLPVLLVPQVLNPAFLKQHPGLELLILLGFT